MKHKKYNHKLISTSEAVDVDDVIVKHRLRGVLMKTHEPTSPSKMIESIEKEFSKRELAYIVWMLYILTNTLEKEIKDAGIDV